jgi:hypothetical protein
LITLHRYLAASRADGFLEARLCGLINSAITSVCLDDGNAPSKKVVSHARMGQIAPLLTFAEAEDTIRMS